EPYSPTRLTLTSGVVMLLTEMEKAYAAGFFDGEGSVQISKKGEREFVLRITAANTNRESMLFFRGRWGGSVYEKKPRNPRHKVSWHWQLSAQQALIFMRDIQPYARIKQPQLDLGIEFQSISRRWGGRSKLQKPED